MRFNRSARIATFLANPTMVLVELNMLGIELMPIKTMTVADAAIAS